MPYHQLRIQTTADYTESISSFLYLFDAVAVTLEDAEDQPVLEPTPGTTPVWQNTFINGLFREAIAAEKIISFLRDQLGATAIANYQVRFIEDQDWERAWLKNFRPMLFGKKLWICPSVFTPPDPDAINIILDPGLAFGTGTHPTTALCLEWLDANPPRDQVVIDYGCGSGILAIAALKLGAREVWAIDHDPQALTATHNNAERNHLDMTKLHINLPDEFTLNHCDLLIANILANPLIELAPLFSTLLKSQGQIVLSGILENQQEQLIKTYQKHFALQKPVQKEEWIRVNGRRV